MIEYVPYSGQPQAMNCPAFVCDACRKQIVGQGNVVWCIRASGYDGPRQQSPIYAAHKGRCDQALELWLRDQYSIDDHWINLWEEIDVFLKQLGNNANRSFADDKRGEYHPVIVRMSSDPHSEFPE